MPSYLVTGVAGFIGSSIAEALLRRGDRVRGIDNFSTGRAENLQRLRGLEFVQGDLADASACARACDGIDVIFHEAALASVPRSLRDPVASNRANVDATVQLLTSAQRARVKRVLYAGSSSVYGNTPALPKREDMAPDPVSPYAVSKAAGEYYLHSFARVFGLETVTLRYFNVFGPYQDPGSPYSAVLARFINLMLNGQEPTIFGDGEQSRDFTFVENVVQGNLLAAQAPAAAVSGRVFNLATGTRVSLNATVKLLRELTGYTGRINHTPERRGDVKHSLADIRLAAEGFGYRPGVSFEEGLTRTVEWYRGATMPSELPSQMLA